MKRKLISALAILSVPVFILGQASREATMITGQVTSAETGEPLVGVNVFVEDTPIGAATDADGNFEIAYEATADFILVFSYIGYKPVRLALSPGDMLTGLNVALEEDVFRGQEVVVTGLTSARAKDVAEVSVSRVDVGALTIANKYQDFSQLMHGKMAGLDVKKASGNVGGGFRFDVRSGGGLNGDQQPTIYIDGVRADNSELAFSGVGGQGISTLADLNPEDIESVEILKGPAGAASYGTRGSNGVVLITSKKGKLTAGTGKRFNVNYKYVTGKNMESYKYTEDNALSYKDANAIFADGDIKQHSVNLTGGSPEARYYVSFDNRYEEGILINPENNYMDRKTIRANLDVFPSRTLTMSISTGYSINEITRPNNDNNIFGWLGNTLLFATSYVFTDSAAISAIKDVSSTKRFIGSLKTTYTPFPTHPMLKGLKFSGTIGLDDSHVRQDNTKSPEFIYGSLLAGERYATIRQRQMFTFDLGAVYTVDLGGLKSVTTITNQSFDTRYKRLMMDKTEFLSSLIKNIGAGANLRAGDEFFYHRREAGIVVNEEVTLGDQFFLTLTGRQDYASTIGEKAASIIYPGARFAWRVDRMGVLPAFVNMFKLRAAYGETGVLPELTDGIPLLWEAEQGGYGAGAVLSGIGNNELEPERIKETEIGIDGEFFGRLAVEATYFMLNAENSIVGRINSPSTGMIATDVPFNVGKMEGSGVELLLQLTPIRSAANRLDLTASISTQKNKVLDLGGAQPIFGPFDLNVIKVGLPKYAFYTKKVLGATFDETTGEYSGIDVAETPDTTDDDRFHGGNSRPDWTGFFSANLRLMKNLSAYILIDTKQGHTIFNNTHLFGAIFGNYKKRNDLAEQLGLVADDPDNDITPLTVGSDEYIAAAHAYAKTDDGYDWNWLEDASYVKLREVSVAYSFRDVLGMLGLQGQVSDLTLAFSANNLKTWTDYSGADPEVNFRGANDNLATGGGARSQDFLTLMTPRTYHLTLTVSF
ncbi:MAG: TonB-dependent receptor [Fidelibacterota bacterium]|nr:MAG: TonB-dependent receptor [Candidatus Neomarinimicrobiota bacterium]